MVFCRENEVWNEEWEKYEKSGGTSKDSFYRFLKEKYRTDITFRKRIGRLSRFIPVGVWTGSFNLTFGARNSFENAVYEEDEEFAEAYYNRWQQILALSEPIGRRELEMAPEWGIGFDLEEEEKEEEEKETLL